MIEFEMESESEKNCFICQDVQTLCLILTFVIIKKNQAGVALKHKKLPLFVVHNVVHNH